MEYADLKLEFTIDPAADNKLIETWNKDTDVLIFNGDIESNTDKSLINILEEKAKHKNVLLFLTTYGGDADAAYRLARYLRCRYDHYTSGIISDCKSAGTLIAIGAHEIVMTRRGELGPLDVQMFRPDEFVQMSSGLTINQALSFVTEKAFETFEHAFLEIRRKSGGIITTKTASDIACSIVNGLYSPITEKIDPTRIGEMQMSLDIALHYGIRLGVKQEIVDHLCKHYPSHGFVIDYEEAHGLLPNVVRLPTEFEDVLVAQIGTVLKKEYRKNLLSASHRGGFACMVELDFVHTPKTESKKEASSESKSNPRKKAPSKS